jgi:hypothetical protein
MDDPLIVGNLAILKSAEKEGLVYGTGWQKNGVWNYFTSFHGRSLLWVGQGRKAARKLYAMANHDAPTLVLRGEQKGSRSLGTCPTTGPVPSLSGWFDT